MARPRLEDNQHYRNYIERIEPLIEVMEKAKREAAEVIQKAEEEIYERKNFAVFHAYRHRVSIYAINKPWKITSGKYQWRIVEDAREWWRRQNVR